MSSTEIMKSLLDYKASANADLFEALQKARADIQPGNLRQALRILNHAHIVDRIFLSHLQAMPHGFTSSWMDEVPAIEELSSSVAATDQAYCAYLQGVKVAQLDERLDFTFTDGQNGSLSRAEMLLHVVTHSGYHRGEVASIVPEVEHASMRDVFAGYLHRAEPLRRYRSTADE